ncbi:MAG TPA: hypothetical protein VFY29_10490 [Terriglobia bacterium]|nr:hypothetical protein [Terriglobia bacterium]
MRQFLAIVLSLTLAISTFAQAPGIAPAAPRTSAVRNSFQELTAHLDAGGNLYLYVSTEELLKGLSRQMTEWRGLFDNVAGLSEEDRQNVDRVFDVLSSIVKNSGVEDVSGFGMSSIALDENLYRVKSMLHHYRGNDSGYLWSVMGRKPHRLDGLDLMPASAALAWYTDLDVPLVWSVLNNEIGKSGIAGASEALGSLPELFNAMTGAELNPILGSLGGEYGVALTLDDTRMMELPAPDGSVMRIPEIGGLLIVKTKDEQIFNLVDSFMSGSAQIFRADRPGLKMRVLTTSGDTQTSLRPAIAQSGEYLMLASNSALIEEAVAVRAGSRSGLRSTEDFRRLSSGVPDEGNSFSFVSPRVGEAIARMQSQIIENAHVDATQRQMLSTFLGTGAGSYGVAANTDEGWVTVSNTTQNPLNVLKAPLEIVPAIMASVVIPALLRSRQSANESSAIANLRSIHAAEVEYYALSNKYGDMRTLVSEGILDERFLSEVSGYRYQIDTSLRGDYLARATPVGEGSGRFEFYVMSEGVVRYSIDPLLSPPGQSGDPVDGLPPGRRGIVRNDDPAAVDAVARARPVNMK